MVYMYTIGADAGLAALPEVIAPYATLEEALLQAEHDLSQGKRVLRIVDDETGTVLWTPETRAEGKEV